MSYAKTISKELIGKGVTINNIAPGYFKTDRVVQLIKARAKEDGISVADYEKMPLPTSLTSAIWMPLN